MSKLSFLDGEPSEPDVVAEAPAPEPAAEPAPEASASEPTAAQPRAPDGKFAPKSEPAAPEPPPAAPAVVVAAEPEPAPAAVQPPPEPGHVPISALLDEREKRQALEKRIADFEAAQAKAKADAEAARPPIPEFEDDPRAHVEALKAQMQADLYRQKVDLLREVATERHGAEKVTEAVTWAQAKAIADPSFNEKALRSVNPIEFAIQQHGQEQLLTRVQGIDLAKFEAWLAAQSADPAQAPIAAAPAAIPPQPAPKPPPPSLVSQPSAGGAAHVPAGPGQAFGALFSG